MRPTPAITAFFLLLLLLTQVGGSLSPLCHAHGRPHPQPAPARQDKVDELAPIRKLHKDIVALSNTIWMQISSLRSKQEADAAAAQFSQSAAQLSQLDRQLQAWEQDYKLPPHAEAELQAMGDEVINAYILLGNEFAQLYNSHCLDSPALQQAFDQALRQGFFYIATNNTQSEDIEFLSPAEAEAELQRLQQLLEPDQKACQYLRQVCDANSAKTAASELLKPIENLHQLRPKPELANRALHPDNEQYAKIRPPLEKALWDIRHQYIRIASTFAPESEDFNTLANTLDELFLSLEETHTHIFPFIFDDSFLGDMDAAFAKHRTQP